VLAPLELCNVDTGMKWPTFSERCSLLNDGAMAVQKMYEVFIMTRRTTADLVNVDTPLKNPILQNRKAYSVTVGLDIDGSR
jgi:hypothetical protein